MRIRVVETGEKKRVTIQRVVKEDFKILKKRRYSFLWKGLVNAADIYKLCLENKEDILGVMAMIDFESECRIEIKLLACSKENIGKDKIYEGIAGMLIAYACRQSVKKYGEMACVSLRPKTKLWSHYMKKYGMQVSGQQLSLEGASLINIILKYLV